MTQESVETPSRGGWRWLVLALVLYGALTVPFVGRMGAGFDEIVDLVLANHYNSDWLIGPSYIPCQMRLPMMATSWVTNGFGPSALYISRWVSVVVTGLAIFGMFLYGRREFGVAGGAIAAIGFATSPFFLPYARMALTESNVFGACAFAWCLFLAASYRQTGKVAWLLGAGVASGLTIASKFTGVIAVPGVLAVVVVVAWRGPKADMPPRARRIGWALLAVVCAAIALPYVVAFLMGADWSLVRSPLPFVKGVLDYYHQHFPRGVKMAHYLVAASASVALGAWALVYRSHRPGFFLAAFVAALGACIGFFIVVPPHLVNPELVWGIVDRILVSENTQPVSGRMGNMVFYFLAWVFKPGPLVGALCLVAPFVHLCLRTRLRHAGSYVVMALAVLSLWTIDTSQPFYMFVPFVAALGLASGLLAGLLRRRRVVGIVVLAILAAQVGADLWMSFPDANLNGYQYLGEDWYHGRATIGYNGVATLPPDGLEQCLRHALKEAPKGSTVWIYAAWSPVQVAWWVLDGTGVKYVMGTDNPDPRAPVDADYVVILHEMDVIARHYTLKALPAGWQMVDREWLATQFDKVYDVKRALGVEAASLWRRKGLPEK